MKPLLLSALLLASCASTVPADAGRCRPSPADRIVGKIDADLEDEKISPSQADSLLDLVSLISGCDTLRFQRRGIPLAFSRDTVITRRIDWAVGPDMHQ